MIRLINVRCARHVVALVFAAFALLPFAGDSALAEGTGSVFINKHICPAGINAANLSYIKLARACQEVGNGFGFTLVTGGISYRQKTGQLQPHAAIWDNVPAHIFTIREKIPGGFGTPVVFCQGNNGSTTFQRMQIFNGNQIRPTLSADGFLYCDWFNVRTS